MDNIDRHTPDSSDVLVSVDQRIFPISIIQYALFTLSDQIDGRIVEQGREKVLVKLTPLVALTEDEIERIWNQTLLTTSVNEYAFQASAPIRNFLAQTALSVSTPTQQTIAEFVTDMITQRSAEHSGAPDSHIDIVSPATQEGEALPPYRIQVNKNESTIDVVLDPRKYLLPDVLWAAHQMRDASARFVLNRVGDPLVAKLAFEKPTVELEVVAERFAHWLEVATERDGRTNING